MGAVVHDNTKQASNMAAVLAVLLTVLPALVAGDLVDDHCGGSVDVDFQPTNFTFGDNSAFISRCKVKFQSNVGDLVDLTITGDMLDRDGCRVYAYDSGDWFSETADEIESSTSFSRTAFGEVEDGGVTLRVQGRQCADRFYNLVVTAKAVCKVSSDHKCGNGKCVPDVAVCDGSNDCSDGSDERDCYWTTGRYLGLGVGGLGSVLILVAAVACCYRYRQRVFYYRRSTVLIPTDNRIVVIENLPNVVRTRC